MKISNDLRLGLIDIGRNLEPFGRVLGTQTGERLKGFFISFKFKNMNLFKTNNSKVIEEIHNEFAIAGDRLLATAKKIISEVKFDNIIKHGQLKKLGFNNQELVLKNKKQEEIAENQKVISEGIMSAKMKYPNHKFITIDMVEMICKKYKLVFDWVDNYKGFVPDKNINEIEMFFNQYPKLRYRSHVFDKTGKWWHKKWQGVCYAEIENYNINNHHFNKNTNLLICAPKKDMIGGGIFGRRLFKSAPDPVILFPVSDGNGDTRKGTHKSKYFGFLILTAWGDEASDELVVNQNNN